MKTENMAPRRGSALFSRVESPQLLEPNKRWYVLRSKVCGERPPKYFSRNKLPTRFPDGIVRVKRSVLRTVDGAPFEEKASSEDEIVASSFGLIAIFLRRLRDFLNDLDLSVLSQEQADGALTHVTVSSTPVAKATANRRLEMPPPSCG